MHLQSIFQELVEEGSTQTSHWIPPTGCVPTGIGDISGVETAEPRLASAAGRATVNDVLKSLMQAIKPWIEEPQRSFAVL